MCHADSRHQRLTEAASVTSLQQPSRLFASRIAHSSSQRELRGSDDDTKQDTNTETVQVNLNEWPLIVLLVKAATGPVEGQACTKTACSF